MGQTWAEEALWKIEDPTLGIESPAVVSTTIPVDGRLPVIHRAIAGRHRLRFTYSGRARTLAPFGLLARHGKWYLIGEDVDLGAERTFRLDRIEGDIEVLDETSFDRPGDFDVRSSFPSDPKALPGAIDVGSDVARVRVDPSDVGVVLSQYGQDALVSRLDDGSGMFDIPCGNVEAFRHWLLGFVDRAEVVEPLSLRDHVRAWVESIERDSAS
jgi:predicted DNA-binding transcriptional regulator YafY